MPWVKTPDDLWDREEVVAVGVEAAALHLAALGYSNRNLTDGRLPGAKAVTLLAVADVDLLIDALVEAGWWTETDAGWQLVYLLDLQPTAASVLAKREATAKRTAAYRARGDSVTDTGTTHAVTTLPHTPSRSRTRSPDPVPSPTGMASGGDIVVANAPPRPSGGSSPKSEPKTGTHVRLAEIIDLVRAAGVPIHPTSRDGGVLKSCAAPAALIAEAYVAAARGDWDPGGTGFLRENLSLHLVIDRLAGYQAPAPPAESRYLLNGADHIGRVIAEPVELAF